MHAANLNTEHLHPTPRDPAPTPRELGVLDTYTASDIHNSMNALINALGDVAREISALRDDIGGLRSEMQHLTENQKRHEHELWDTDGASRIRTLKASIESLDLRIKGIWAVLAITWASLSAYVLSHLK